MQPKFNRAQKRKLNRALNKALNRANVSMQNRLPPIPQPTGGGIGSGVANPGLPANPYIAIVFGLLLIGQQYI